MKPRDKKLLSLVMIVKNEALSIEKTLLSCKPHIDRWTIVDTGSIDDTKEIIRRVYSDVPGQLVELPFVDFSTTRNAALDLETEVTFTLMLSGGEFLQNGESLRLFCLDHENDTEGAYDVETVLGTARYKSPRLARVSAKWRHAGVTHEVLVSPDGKIPSKCVLNAWIFHEKTGSSRSRWLLDVHLLEKEWEHQPSPRTAFYLGQTYECLNQTPLAIAWYERRIAMGGWHEEVYEASFRLAKMNIIRPDGSDEHTGVLQMLDVHSMAPYRCEPLYEIGLHYYRQGKFSLGLLFAQRAASLPYPKHDRLFVIDSYYKWQAWDLVACCAGEDRELGLMAAKKALEGNPNDERLQRNVAKLENTKTS